MTTTPPIEAPCDACHQPRRLFLYEPHHGHPQPPQRDACRWCSREAPLLCARCWSAERQAEADDPARRAEFAVMQRICAANVRAEERRAADRAACDGIAEATARAERRAS